MDFLEYLLPRLFPNYERVSGSESRNISNKPPTYPDIESPFHQLKRQASLLVCETNPDFGVHQKTVM